MSVIYPLRSFKHLSGRFWRRLRRALRALWIGGLRLALLLALLGILGDGESVDRSLRGRVTALARPYLFDYVGWEVDALWVKLRQEVLGVHPYLDDDTHRALVLSYLDRVAQAMQLDQQITRIYADPTVTDAAAASADLRAQRDALRCALEADQPLVEGVIESQVSAVLADEGFAVLGQVLPPVSMHFSPLPTELIVSPRDRIACEVGLELVALAVDERAALEDRIDSALDVSSLVVPLGGLSLFPSMIIETAQPARAFEVTAHEWSHHYLVFAPLGLEYSANPETRIINETVATFAGREIAQKVIARFYPELPIPQYPSFLDAPAAGASAAEPATTEPPRDPDEPPPWDYGRAMHATRAQVDFLLWQGKVEAAELYMEIQRREFVRRGYTIRKLNQAYFAFYGGYQGAPGAGGTDPIGPAVEELRRLSPDFKTWLDTLSGITTRAELLAAVESAR